MVCAVKREGKLRSFRVPYLPSYLPAGNLSFTKIHVIQSHRLGPFFSSSWASMLGKSGRFSHPLGPFDSGWNRVQVSEKRSKWARKQPKSMRNNWVK